jgi:hypothetical protein
MVIQDIVKLGVYRRLEAGVSIRAHFAGSGIRSVPMPASIQHAPAPRST